jgi:manganese transport protein
MPHNLYLHSALVQTRKFKRDEKGIKRALKINFIDTTIALNLAFFVNAAILILAASVFYYSGIKDVAEIKDAHRLLEPMLGSKLAPYLFAIALIAAGQSSTVTGTLAGQIVMEGYLRLRINPWMRRLLTRMVAIIPAVIIILINGEENIMDLLVLSQVILSLQLGFAIIPLIHFVSDKKTMGAFTIKPITKILAWLIAVILVSLNVRWIVGKAGEYFEHSDNIFWKAMIILGGLAAITLLLFSLIYPLLNRKPKDVSLQLHKATTLTDIDLPAYKRIAVALDFSIRDQHLIANAIRQANKEANIILIHIVESASAKVYGADADDFETRKDQEKLDEYALYLQQKGFAAESKLGFRNRNKEIPRLVNEAKADLLIIGAHGHSGVKDWLYGETIDAVRHQLKIPVLIVHI